MSVTPDVFANDIFAMKGGTAINLFVRDMPRLAAGGRTHADWHQAVGGPGDRRWPERPLQEVLLP